MVASKCGVPLPFLFEPFESFLTTMSLAPRTLLDSSRKISAVLLDITGVLYESGEGGGKVIPGSPEAVIRLRKEGYKLKFCTNETQITRQLLVEKLTRHGYSLTEEEVHSPAPACRHFLKENDLRPYLLVHPDALADYKDVDTTNPNAVVLGDATDRFTYDNLNHAFKILITQERPDCLISLGRGRYYKEGSELTLDVGPYMKALEYATGLTATVIGKPSASFFTSALSDLGVPPDEAVMIGDDVVNDVGGAQGCGMAGVLVRTGKYRPEDEHHPMVKPDRVVDNLSQAVDLLLNTRQN